MKSTNWSRPQENELADEAIRLMPAIAAARLRDDRDGIRRLYGEYEIRACDLGIDGKLRWQIYAVSSMAWVIDLVRMVADEREVSHDEAAMIMVGRALVWTCA